MLPSRAGLPGDKFYLAAQTERGIHMYRINIDRLTAGGQVVTMTEDVVPTEEKFEFIDLNEKAKGKNTEQNIDIVVLAHDDVSATLNCIRSIYRNTPTWINWTLTVIDNASDLAMQEALSVFDEIKIVRMKEHNGYLPAMQVGVQVTEGDWIVYVDQQVTVGYGWLQGILLGIETSPRVALVTPWSNKELPIIEGNGFDFFSKVFFESSDGQSRTLSFPSRVCFAVKRSVLESLGGWDVEYYSPGYGEVADFYMRAMNAKWISVRGPGSYIFDESKGKSNIGSWLENKGTGFERFLVRWGTHPLKAFRRDGDRDKAKLVVQRFLALYESKKEECKKVIFLFRDFELCGAILAAVHLCNGLNECGYNATIAFARNAPGHDSKMIPARFAPIQRPTRQELANVIGAINGKVFLVATTSIVASEVASIALGKDNIHSIYFVQDDESRFTNPVGTPYFENGHVDKTYAMIDDKVSNSAWVEKLLKKKGFDSTRIPIGVNVQMFRPLERKAESIRVGAHCRPSTTRRGWPFVVAVVNAAAREDDFEFVVFDQEYEKDELSMAIHSNLGQLRPYELAREMGTFDVFIEGSSFQGFGMQALEAMSCGCALLSTRNGGIEEYGKTTVNCLMIKYGDIKGAAKQLVALIKNTKRRKEIGIEARKTAIAFDWQNIVMKWDNYLGGL